MTNDPRPAVEHWQLNTVKGKTLLTLQAVAGERTYKDNDPVTQEDFYWPYSQGKADKFRGTVQAVNVAWDSFYKRANQTYTIHVTQHDAITDGRFKPRTTLRASKPAVANTMAGNIKTVPVSPTAAVLFQPPPEKPVGPGVRQFNFEEE